MASPNDERLRMTAEMPHIDGLWAFLAVDDDGDEGLCGFVSEGMWVAMVAADETRVRALRDFARAVAVSSNRPVRLVHFDHRSDVEVIEP
jgi:hypothetical protein